MTWTPSVTRTKTPTGTPTNTPRPGADVSFLGLARLDDVLLTPLPNTTPQVYQQPLGYLFRVVIEAKRGPSGLSVGLNAFRYDPFDPTVRPDLEVIVSRPLGDGSPAVCDNMLPTIGGVPASPDFDVLQPVSDAINDFACRFVDGAGNPGGRGPGEQCTIGPDDSAVFGNPASSVQFCADIAKPFGFPVGDTLVTARVRDISGQPGQPASFIVRVLPPQ